MTFSKTVPENILEATKIVSQVIRRKQVKALETSGTSSLIKAATKTNSAPQHPSAEGEDHGRLKHRDQAANGTPEHGCR